MNFCVVKLCGSITVYHFRHEQRSLFSAEQISHISRTVCSHISLTGHKSRRGERTHKQALTAPPIPIYPHPPSPSIQTCKKLGNPRKLYYKMADIQSMLQYVFPYGVF